MTEMRTRLVVAALAVAIVTSSLAAIPALGATATDRDTRSANLSSGASLSGAFAVHRTDLAGELDRRELDVALARADGDASRARMLATRRIVIERRIEALETRRESLGAARVAGNLSTTAYRIELVQLAADADRLRVLLRATERATTGLSPELRGVYGIDDESLRRTRTRTSALPGTDGPTLYRAVTGQDLDWTAADTEGMPGNETRRALERIRDRRAELSATYDVIAANGGNAAPIECGERSLASAARATEGAGFALSVNRTARAESELVEARLALAAATACLRRVDPDVAYDPPDWRDEYDVESTDPTFRYRWDDFEWNESTWDESRWADDEWNRSDYRDRDAYDRTWTPRPTPTPYPTWDDDSTRSTAISEEK